MSKHVFRRTQPRPRIPAPRSHAPAQFQARFELGGLGAAAAFDRAEVLDRGILDAFEASEARKQGARVIESALARAAVAGAQHNRDKFGIGQRTGPRAQEFFPWPVLLGPILD